MSYVVIEDFKLGLDVTREEVAGPAGSLYVAKNVHITRGGEIETRKKAVSTYSLPSGTFGLLAAGDTLYCFGSATDPDVPSGVTYQRLRHPDLSTAMSAVLDAEAVAGKAYVVAEFADDSVHHFYDGDRVTAWTAGVVTDQYATLAEFVETMKNLVDADDNYVATRTGTYIDITGPAGDTFTVTVAATNGGSVNDQTITATTTQQAVAAVAEVQSSGTFRILGGSVSAGVNKITSVAVNGAEVLSTAVDYAASPALTAAAVAAQINSYASTPEYTAEADGDTVTITAAAGTGETPNGYSVTVVAAGDVICTTGEIQIVSGSASAGVNKVSSITDAGTEILGVAVDWTTSNAATATAVAAQIRTYGVANAYADGDRVLIGTKIHSNGGPNNNTIAVTNGGDVTTSVVSNNSKTATAFSGGVDAVAGQEQISRVTFGGTLDVGDRFTITLTRNNIATIFGAAGNPEYTGRTATLHKGKVYSVVDSNLFFSAYREPTIWNRDDAEPGAGVIDMASEEGGSETLYGAEAYQGNLAVFARQTIQVWALDADPASNVRLQTLRNTGTRAGRSIRAFGNNDVFYLADSGIRSLRARDSSNAAFASDVGVAIDPAVRDYLKTLTATQIENAVSVMEPEDDRYWLAVGERVYVFSFFPGKKVSAWSHYEFGFEISDFARIGQKLYMRSGDTIYLYGGADGDTYCDDGEMTAQIQTPYITAGKPATRKTLSGFDCAISGQWSAAILRDPRSALDKSATIVLTETSYPNNSVGLVGETTHFAVQMTNTAGGRATISNVCVHYDMDEAA